MIPALSLLTPTPTPQPLSAAGGGIGFARALTAMESAAFATETVRQEVAAPGKAPPEPVDEAEPDPLAWLAAASVPPSPIEQRAEDAAESPPAEAHSPGPIGPSTAGPLPPSSRPADAATGEPRKSEPAGAVPGPVTAERPVRPDDSATGRVRPIARADRALKPTNPLSEPIADAAPREAEKPENQPEIRPEPVPVQDAPSPSAFLPPASAEPRPVANRPTDGMAAELHNVAAGTIPPRPVVTPQPPPTAGQPTQDAHPRPSEPISDPAAPLPAVARFAPLGQAAPPTVAEDARRTPPSPLNAAPAPSATGASTTQASSSQEPELAAPAAPVSRDVAAQAPGSPAIVPRPLGSGPAGQVFAAEFRRVARERSPAVTLDAAPAPVATALPGMAPAASAPAIDLRAERWPEAMIERIERLRDAAEVADTRVRLVPDALGRVEISLRREGEAVHVHLAAEQAATRALLQDAAPRLAEAAEARGLKLGQLGVGSGGADAHGGQRQAPAPALPLTPPRARQDAPVEDPTDTRIA